MSKYRKLTDHLSLLQGGQWTASFEDIEAVLGFPLPRSAYTYPAWWSNQAGDGHSQTLAWQSVGWRTGEVDLVKQRVTFSRQEADQNRSSPNSVVHKSDGLTIAEAKAGLSAYFGVPSDHIEITIRG